MTPLKSEYSVRISRVEYDALLSDRERLKMIRLTLGIAPNPGYGMVSPIDRDDELAEFISKRFRTHTLAGIAGLCKAKFGPDRAPSKSSIQRYWARLNGSKTAFNRSSKPSSNEL